MNDPYDQCECPLCHNTGFVSSEDYDEYIAAGDENERLKALLRDWCSVPWQHKTPEMLERTRAALERK